MDVFEMSELLSQRMDLGQLHLEFFKAPTMSLGVYELARDQSIRNSHTLRTRCTSLSEEPGRYGLPMRTRRYGLEA